jgi:DNA-binding GntR family transcriptional regulator
MNRMNRIGRGAAALLAEGGDWQPVVPQTLVDVVTETIIAQAARGAVLPGDRLVEADLARKLGVSRVPVREALRLLESQGIVVNEPYKGIRLRPVTNAHVRDLVEARTALETTAALAAVAAGRHRGAHLHGMRETLAAMDAAVVTGDGYALAAADTGFHRALVKLGGNAVIHDLWEALARQMTIIFGLATLGKPMAAIATEHHDLLAVIADGDVAAIPPALHEHITVMNLAVDYEAILAARRSARASVPEAVT